MSLNDIKRKKLDFPLYCITAENLSKGRDNITVVKEMLAGGAKIIQYREKYKSIGERYRECLEINRLCKEKGCTFIINDNIDIALLVHPDGVHIGQDDLPIEKVRQLVGEETIIGLSTHNPQQAKEAVSAGADYIGAGPVFSTKTKDNVCAPVGTEYLKFVSENIPIPHVAIGGIKENNLDTVLDAGAKCVCLISDITGAENIKEKVERLCRHMNRIR